MDILASVLFVSIFLLAPVHSGSDIQFTTNSNIIQGSAGQILQLRCAIMFSDTGGGVVGRRTADDNVVKVASISITRNGRPVATVTTYNGARMWSNDISANDSTTVKVSGDVIRNPEEFGFLQVTWTSPTNTQAGEYECKAAGLSSTDQVAKFFVKTLTVDKACV